MRIFTKLRKVFVNLSAHFRPQPILRPITLARRGLRQATDSRQQATDSRQQRGYTKSSIHVPTLLQTGPTSPKRAASVHENINPCTDATKQRIFIELLEEKRMICFIFTDTSCISGEMRKRQVEKIM